MGAELCLAHDMGGVEAYGGPLSVDMQPYSCFIWKYCLNSDEISKFRQFVTDNFGQIVWMCFVN